MERMVREDLFEEESKLRPKGQKRDRHTKGRGNSIPGRGDHIPGGWKEPFEELAGGQCLPVVREKRGLGNEVGKKQGQS